MKKEIKKLSKADEELNRIREATRCEIIDARTQDFIETCKEINTFFASIRER